MASKASALWPRLVGYPLFFAVCFLFFFHLTLPYPLLQSRLADEVRKNGYALSMVSLGPALGFGVTAKGVTLSNLQSPAAAAPAGAPASVTLIDQLTVRPTLLPLGIKVSAKAFSGEVQAQLAGYTSGTKGEGGGFTRLDGLSIKNLDLARAGLKPTLGVDLAGVLNAEGEVSHFNELSKASGSLKLSGKDLQLVSGTVAMFDLPKVSLGALDLRVKMDAGKASLDKFSATGGDVEANGEGDITLNNRLGASQSKLHIEFKPAEEWLKKNSFIQLGLSQAGRPDSRGFYTVNLDGMLGNPRPTLKQ
jgi:type II secretion system protein N